MTWMTVGKWESRLEGLVLTETFVLQKPVLSMRRCLTLLASIAVLFVAGCRVEVHSEVLSERAPARSHKPKADQFEVVSLVFLPQEAGDFVDIQGEVKNNGTIPGIPRLLYDQYNEAGEMIEHNQFYTSAFVNVEPGGTAAFRTAVKKKIFDPKRAKLKVFDAWNRD